MDKICTTIEQSKKLIELGVNVNTADMYWWSSGKKCYIAAMDDGDFNEEEGNIPAWSLTALLSILDFPALTQEKEDEWEVCVCDYDNDGYIEEVASNPIDACYKMILKLHEQNLL